MSTGATTVAALCCGVTPKAGGKVVCVFEGCSQAWTGCIFFDPNKESPAGLGTDEGAVVTGAAADDVMLGGAGAPNIPPPLALGLLATLKPPKRDVLTGGFTPSAVDVDGACPPPNNPPVVPPDFAPKLKPAKAGGCDAADDVTG